MLANVFLRLSEGERSFLRFLTVHVGANITALSISREHLLITTKEKEYKWSAAVIYKKLKTSAPVVSLPVIWKLLKYYEAGEDSSKTVRDYCRDSGCTIEPVPFMLGKGSCLITEGVVTTTKKKPESGIYLRKKGKVATVKVKPTQAVIAKLLHQLEELAI